MNPKKIREDFPIFKERQDLIYLDSAATSQKPRQVIEAVSEFYEKNNANIGRGLYDLAGVAYQEYEDARKETAEFINASKNEIVFVRNTTEAENLLAHSMDFEGDIVVSEMSHHSEQLPWRRKAEEDGRDVNFLETKDGKIDVDSAEESINEETGVVAISHVSNLYGAENRVEKIVEIAHRNNAVVVLDAAQSAPHMSLDVKELGVDFMCFSGHKMLAPTGIGVLYGKKEKLPELEPYQVGGGMISSVKKEDTEYAEAPEKFEAGTPHSAGAIGLKTAIEYLEEIGMDQVEKHTRNLAKALRKELSEILGVEVISPEGSLIVSFTAEFAHPHDIAEVLNQNNVAVRAGHHCVQTEIETRGITGAVRASPYIYNTEEEVQKLVEAVREAREVFDV